MSSFEHSAVYLDMSPRFAFDTTVDASPAAAAETVIATLNLPQAALIATGIRLNGWAAFTVGTSGTASTLRIRQTGLAGTVIATTGACTRTAAQLVEQGVQGIDTAPLAARVYVLTLEVTAGSAVSTVSAVELDGLIV